MTGSDISVLRVGLSLSLFVGSLAIGWGLARWGVLTPPRASRLIRTLIRFVTPIVLCSVFWRIELGQGRLLWLPVLGALISASMLVPAWLVGRVARFSRPRMGSLLTCAFFSNVGYLGAFTAFALFGEEAFGLCMLYLVFFGPCMYTIGFWIARHFGHREDLELRQPTFVDELQFLPLAGMAVGLALNFFGVPRPGLLGPINAVVIPLDLSLYLIGIGSQVTVRPIRQWLGTGLAMSGIKFLYAPAVAWLLVTMFGLEGLPRFVVLLEASTPVAVSALMFPLLFGLDRELTSALWLFTTALAIPWLLLVIPWLQRL